MFQSKELRGLWTTPILAVSFWFFVWYFQSQWSIIIVLCVCTLERASRWTQWWWDLSDFSFLPTEKEEEEEKIISFLFRLPLCFSFPIRARCSQRWSIHPSQQIYRKNLLLLPAAITGGSAANQLPDAVQQNINSFNKSFSSFIYSIHSVGMVRGTFFLLFHVRLPFFYSPATSFFANWGEPFLSGRTDGGPWVLDLFCHHCVCHYGTWVVCSILILLLLWGILDAQHNDVPFLKDPDSLSSNRARLLLQYLPPYLVLCGISSRVFNVLWRVIVPLPSFFSRPQLFSAASSSDTSVFFFRQTKTDGRTDGIKSLFKYKRQNFTCRLLCPFPPPGSIIAPFFCWLASKILNFYDDGDDGVRRYNI